MNQTKRVTRPHMFATETSEKVQGALNFTDLAVSSSSAPVCLGKNDEEDRMEDHTQPAVHIDQARQESFVLGSQEERQHPFARSIERSGRQ